MRNKKFITAETFVRIWQSSETVGEVIEKTGLSPSGVYSRASFYRKKGIPLKKLRTRTGKTGKVDWDELKKLARELLEDTRTDND